MIHAHANTWKERGLLTGKRPPHTSKRNSPTPRGHRVAQESGSNSLMGIKLAWLIRKQSRWTLSPILKHCHSSALLHLYQLTIALRKK
jgi:hypothetical protein